MLATLGSMDPMLETGVEGSVGGMEQEERRVLPGSDMEVSRLRLGSVEVSCGVEATEDPPVVI